MRVDWFNKMPLSEQEILHKECCLLYLWASEIGDCYSVPIFEKLVKETGEGLK